MRNLPELGEIIASANDKPLVFEYICSDMESVNPPPPKRAKNLGDMLLRNLSPGWK